jgi:hypothetical protein
VPAIVQPHPSVITSRGSARGRQARGHRTTLWILVIFGVAAVAAAGPARAATPVEVMRSGSGLTAPAAVVEDPGGGIWVADHLMGFCKLQPAIAGSPGALIEGPSCNLDPTLRVGPVEVASAVFDPAESAFYVGGAAADGGIWRLGYKSGPMNTSGTIDGDPGKTFQILSLPTAGEIVFGMGFDPGHPGGAVLDFTTKRTNSVYRLVDPGSCPPFGQPPLPCTQTDRFQAIGNAAIAGGGPVTHLNGFVYLGEDSGVTRFPSPPSLPAGVQNATPVQNGPPAIISSLAADPTVDGGRLYVGTFDVNPSDTVYVMGGGGTGDPVPYVTQLGAVSALSVGSHGTLLVGDDPGLLSGVEGTGRVFSLALTSLLAPQVVLTAAPPAATNAFDVTMSYSSRSGVAFECRFDPPSGALQAGWEPCGVGPSGSRSYIGLAEGPHRFEVRAVDSATDPNILQPIGPGPRMSVSFTVDRVAPIARIDNPASDHSAPSGNLTMRFSADDATAAFQCSLNGTPWIACSSGHAITGLTGADYQFQVRAVDGAGNVGPAAPWDFVVDPSKRARLRIASLSGVSRGPVSARVRIVGRRLVITIPAPAGSRFARIAIERKGKVRANGLPSRPKVLQHRTARLTPGRTNVVIWAPSPGKLGRVVNLRSIRVMVRVGPTLREIGPARAAVFATKARFWRLAPAKGPAIVQKGARP